MTTKCTCGGSLEVIKTFDFAKITSRKPALSKPERNPFKIRTSTLLIHVRLDCRSAVSICTVSLHMTPEFNTNSVVTFNY
jgi:hypothetical protein